MKTNIPFGSRGKGKYIVSLFLFLGIILFSEVVVGVTKTAVISGNWNSGATWGGTAPGVSDDIVIPAPYSVTVTVSTSCKSLTLGDVAGSITINSGIILIIKYFLTCSPGCTNDLIGGTGTIFFNGSLTPTGSNPVVITSNINANTSFCNVTFYHLSKTLICAGVIKIDGGTLSISGYGAAATSIIGTNAANILISSGTLTVSGDISGGSPSTLFPSMTVDGILAATGYVNVDNLKINGLFRTAYSGVEGWWNSTYSPSTLDITLGTIEYSGVNQTVAGNLTYFGLITSNSGTKSLSNNITIPIDGGVSIGSASTFDAKGFVISGEGSVNLEAGSTFATAHVNGLNGSNMTTGGTDWGSSSDFIFNGSGAQVTGTQLPTSVNNLTVGNTSVLTLSNSSLSVSGAFTVKAGATYDTKAITIGGAGKIVVEDNATLITAHPNGINGIDGTSGGSTYGIANYTFNYAGSQTTGSKLPLTINNLKVDGTSTLTLSHTIDCHDVTTTGSAHLVVPPGVGLTSNGAANFANPLILKATTGTYHSQIGTYINYGSVSGTSEITMELAYKTNGYSGNTGRGTYFTPPISNAMSGILTPNGTSNRLLYVDVSTRTWAEITNNTTPLTFAKGYLYRSTADGVKLFQGTPNADLSYTISSIPRVVDGQFYLMGNPYPAVIDWNTFTLTNITNTIWYRTSTASGLMVVEHYNGGADVGTNANGIAPVDGKIAPMQAFWVQCASIGSGNIVINTNSRSHVWGHSTFLKSSSNKTSQKDIIRLDLYTNSNRDESIIVQSESAEDNFDSWDSKKMFSKDVQRAEFYTISPEKTNLAIQSVKPITESKAIRLGLSVGQAGEYKFLANFAESSIANNIYLEDKKSHIMQNLITNPEYVFTSDIAGFSAIPDDTSRFVIHFSPIPKVIANNSIAVCSPETVDLTASSITSGSTAGLSYSYWTDAAATIQCTNSVNAGTGIYYIKGTDVFGAFSISDPITVTINPKPTVITTNQVTVASPATVNLTAPEITLGSTPELSFSYWTDANATLPYNTPQTAAQGDYYIKGTIVTTGCYSIAGPVSVVVTTDAPTVSAENTNIYSYGNQVYIDNCELNSIITIYDILGRQTYSSISKSDHEIITSNFKSGIYIVKVVNNKDVKSKKIFIR